MNKYKTKRKATEPHIKSTTHPVFMSKVNTFRHTVTIFKRNKAQKYVNACRLMKKWGCPAITSIKWYSYLLESKDKSKIQNEEAIGKLLYCSFCSKNQYEVSKLIAGPCVYICSECVALCNDIVGK